MREKIKLVSSAGTGHFYTTNKNKRTMPEKLEIKKFDPEILSFVKDHGETSSNDFKELGNADPTYASWKSGRLGGTALENLWLLGKLVVSSRDSNFRKFYDLSSNFIPENLLFKLKLDQKKS